MKRWTRRRFLATWSVAGIGATLLAACGPQVTPATPFPRVSEASFTTQRKSAGWRGGAPGQLAKVTVKILPAGMLERLTIPSSSP